MGLDRVPCHTTIRPIPGIHGTQAAWHRCSYRRLHRQGVTCRLRREVGRASSGGCQIFGWRQLAPGRRGLKPGLKAQVGSSRLPAQSTSSGLALSAGDLSPGGLCKCCTTGYNPMHSHRARLGSPPFSIQGRSGNTARCLPQCAVQSLPASLVSVAALPPEM
jgi:hypothetical protein